MSEMLLREMADDLRRTVLLWPTIERKDPEFAAMERRLAAIVAGADAIALVRECLPVVRSVEADLPPYIARAVTLAARIGALLGRAPEPAP